MPFTPENWSSGDGFHISAHFAPRLYDGTQLGQFTGFTAGGVSWPETVSALGFTVDLNGISYDAELISAPDVDLWNHLFSNATPVIPHEYPDHKARRLRSFPVLDLYKKLKELYEFTAEESPEEFIPVRHKHHPRRQFTSRSATLLDQLVNNAGVLAEDQTWKRIDGYIAQLMSGDVPYVTPAMINQIAQATAMSPLAVQFHMMQRFYRRPRLENGPPPQLPEIDFHVLLGILGDYPVLLRRLGIVADLRITPQGTPPASGYVAVNISGNPGGQVTSMRTRYEFNAGASLFTSAGKDGNQADIRAGRLRLDASDRYELVQVDADSMVMKTMNMLGNLWLRNNNHVASNYATPEAESLPSLRTAGLAVIKPMNVQVVHQAFLAAFSLNTAFTANQPQQNVDQLRFEDVLQGYAIDVFDVERGRWYSLCQRNGRYRLGEPFMEFTAEDEGFVADGVVTSNADGLEDDLYVHDAVFQWDGWSLVAEKPGNTIIPEDVADDAEPGSIPHGYERSGRVKQTPPPEFPLDTAFIPRQGSLPKLRYGRTYRIRARAVDIAGNVIPLNPESGDMAHATDQVRFTRFEPVLPPAIILRTRLTEGESSERMVIRSNYDATTQEYGNDPDVQQAISAYGHAYLPDNQRHLAPAKAAQITAEMHGEFDQAIGNGQNIQQWFNIAVKERGSFNDTHIIDVNSGQPTIPVQGQELITPSNLPPDVEPVQSLNDLGPGDTLAPGQYVLHNTNQVQLPYLPDPLAGTAAFRGLPGAVNDSIFVSFNLNFPDAEPFRVIITEGDGPPQFNASDPVFGARVLRVFLKKAEIVTVKLSAALGEDDLPLMGLWNWLSEKGLPAAKMNELRGLILRGRHWMFTPPRELVMVHAVQQPLEEASFNQITAAKQNIGETFARLAGRFSFHCKSTGRLDFLADWDEPFDDPTRPLPQDGIDGREIIHKEGRVLEMPIEPFYEERSALDFPVKLNEVTGYPYQKHGQPDFYDHDFGDTKHRRVRYYLNATTRFRDYFPPEIYEKSVNISRNGPVTEVKVPNSARPDAPNVLYVVPTFGWEQEQVAGGNVSRRCGGGLRVYLDRPWYSSGEGELLGVVMTGSAPAATPTPGTVGGFTGAVAQPQIQLGALQILAQGGADNPLRLLTTQCGMDPIWKSAGTPASLGPANFPEAVKSQNGLTFAEADGVYASVAGHEVHFDEERKLWYSDIVVDLGQSYYPFIRMALARYQPESIAGAHLSRIVLADFIQPAPDRTAAVMRPVPSQIRVMVSGVFGMNKPSVNIGQNPIGQGGQDPIRLTHRVVATLEQRNQGSQDAWLPAADKFTEVELDPVQQYDARMLWMTTFELGTPDPGDTILAEPLAEKEYRVVVREYEMLPVDQVQHGMTVSTVGPSIGKRIVYADVIEVPPAP
ncbi:MAG: hypothetical protein EA364_12030 [Balneolaceae bacterium]|nr:MAG: hypothetical protein EA364_12030 [Balneolaceae bacterium]